MKKALIFASIILSGLSFSQESKFSLGINYAPEVAYRTSLMEGNQQNIRYGFSTGPTVQLHATERLTFQTGVSYAEGGFADDVIKFTDMNGITVSEIRTKYRSRHIQVPINVLYTFNTTGPQFYAGLGVSPGYLADIESRNEINYSTGDIFAENHSKEGANLFSLNANVLAGLKFPIGSVSAICIEPVFRYGIIPLTDSSLEYRLWNAGVNFSYQINL